MTQRNLFSSGMELAPFVTSSGLLCRSWDVISSRCAGIISNVGVGLAWKVYKEPEKDLTIIAFEATPDSSNLQADLDSSSDLKEKNFLHFEFLCSKSNSIFSVNSTAISLFFENHQRLDQLKSEIISSPRLIVTGHALGGAIASLFTLSLLGSGKKGPLCITFGSPLLGDKRLQEAISRSATWNSCFLHVVSLKDPLPRLFITKPTSAYMPFGTFLLCSDANSTCFENPNSILTLLEGSIHDQNQVFQSVVYGNIVESLYHKAICMDLTARTKDTAHSNSLHASIILQLWALRLTPHMQQQQENIDINTLVTKMETLEKKFIFQKRIKFDPSKKLNIMKTDMAQLEWYKKDSKNRNIGYYDSYKEILSSADEDVRRFHCKLTNYWEKMVEEAEMNPQKEGAAFRIGWLIAGTSYRRMVEPLAIAEYYRGGGKDYVTKGRSKHFKQLEHWLIEETKGTSNSNNTSTRNVESILTVDSCFWAHVEEALLSCKQLNNVESSVTEKEEANMKLLEFEEYVCGLLMNYAVSPEIFLKESSYMRWWNWYKAIKGTSYSSALAHFMSNASNYQGCQTLELTRRILQVDDSRQPKQVDLFSNSSFGRLGFSSGMELAPFVTNTGLLQRSWNVIASRHASIISNIEVGLSWKVYKELVSDLTIIAFEATQDSSNLQADLVPSFDLKEKNFLHFDFLCSKSNPSFCVNSTAVSLFYENHQKLDQLKSEFNSSPRVIVTGHALGGAIASLFTLSLLDGIGSEKKSPLCITFGSPLIGDKRLQEAISRSSTWNSCFLHVVSHKDPLPRLFITNPTSAYMPFGTFLLCSDANSTCFENPDSVLTLLGGSVHDQNQVFQSVDYGNMVESLYHKAICMDLTVQTEDTTHSNSLHASISLQSWSLGLTPHTQQQQQENIDINTLVKIFDPSEKLALMKIVMAQLEWYKKDSKNRNIGYYDSYKNMLLSIDKDVVKLHENLTNYWEKMVEEAEMNPQREGAAFRIGWLIAGTSYRRMVEPLTIAKYYRDGGKDYVTKGRSKHFKQLEHWLTEETTGTSSSNNASTKNVESILTVDSCFWAHVEEALLSCKQLNNVESSVTEKEEANRKLLEFEKYVYVLLKNYAVSPEIFLKKSSFMRWWNLYKAIKRTSYNSELARFMHDADYE